MYLITCTKCKVQYAGQTRQKSAYRMSNNIFYIAHFPETFTNVSEHFDSPGHSIQDVFLSLLIRCQMTGKGS